MTINRYAGAILLIAGTCIGAGMLGLPISSAHSGFLPSVALLLLCWLAMWLTGLYVLEVNLWLPANANFVSMSRASLGRAGEIVAWLTYLLLLYSLLSAYLSAGGDMVAGVAALLAGAHIHVLAGTIPWILIAATIIYLGVKSVDTFNRLLVLGLLISFVFLVIFTVPHVRLIHLENSHPRHLLLALPIFIGAFGYHVIIPGLSDYLKGDSHKLKKIILFGSMIPLLTYLLWQAIVFGVIQRNGPHGLLSILHSGEAVSQLVSALAHTVHNAWLFQSAELFIFFAIASSFLGLSFSLSDFIADGFHIPKNKMGRMFIIFITFVPPLLFVWLYPHGFILALNYAGVFVAILHGILPTLMVAVGRWRGLRGDYRAPGGALAMLMIIALSLLVIVAEYWQSI